MKLALGYYNEKRLAVAIQNSANVGKPSRATLTSIKEIIGQLRKACDPFKYGRNHTHTLSGIVWTLAGLRLILRLRADLRIPEPYQSPDELVPAAHDLLLGTTGPALQGNRYTTHRDCAESGRAILLDVQGLDFDSGTFTDADLEQWLDDVESTFSLSELVPSDLGHGSRDHQRLDRAGGLKERIEEQEGGATMAHFPNAPRSNAESICS